MATLRSSIRIDRSADEVWKVVSDAGSVADWFPAFESSSATADTRTITVGGIELVEDIVTNDSELRRFQYRVRSGLPVEYHLGTVDVLEDGDNALVVYSTEIQPDSLAELMGPTIESGVQHLKAHVEGTAG